MNTKRKGRYKGKKVLIMGLGLHGGGVATAAWFVAQGAVVTATDLRSAKVLATSLRKLKGLPIRFVLGEHRASDFTENDIVVVNPGVPRESSYLRIARRAKKSIINDTAIFFLENQHPVIGVTGTRGKTTTTEWIAQLLKHHFADVRPSGNTPDNAALKELVRKKEKHTPIVAELSSWQLEFLPGVKRAPEIAVITNLYPDHLNRYKDMKAYADAKAGIFSSQSDSGIRILNYDNEWFQYFKKKKHAGETLVVSEHILPERYNGIYVHDHHAVIRRAGKTHTLCSIQQFRRLYGQHNLSNLLTAILAIHCFDPNISFTEKQLLRLRTPRMRQQVVYHSDRLLVVNDSCATSPDGVIAALDRFNDEHRVVLITGGTDKLLDYRTLATKIRECRDNIDLVLLEGSGTTKLIAELKKLHVSHPKPHASLADCVEQAWNYLKPDHSIVLLFSPGGSSFEKFLHEFDRGEQFNSLIQQYLK